MAEVATAHLLLPDHSEKTSTEKRKKREESEGAQHGQTGPTPLPQEQESDARGLEMQAACPLAELNRQILQGGEGAPARPCLQARRVDSGTRSCLLVELT